MIAPQPQELARMTADRWQAVSAVFYTAVLCIIVWPILCAVVMVRDRRAKERRENKRSAEAHAPDAVRWGVGL